MDRQRWVDVAAGSLTLLGFLLVWIAVVRAEWAGSLRIALEGRSVLLLLGTVGFAVGYHALALGAAALLAIRTASRGREVYQRLFPTAALPLAAIYAVSLCERRFLSLKWPAVVGDIGLWLLVVNAVYAGMWIVAWTWRRVRNLDTTGEEEQRAPIYKRPGVQLWITVLVVGVGLLIGPRLFRQP